MDPYLIEVARNMNRFHSVEMIKDVLDALEFLYDALDDEQQSAAAEVIAELPSRLRRFNQAGGGAS